MATMQDVARRANVAVSTVSYVLSGTRPVTQQTRDRVTAAIAELGYRPNAAARSLASRRSDVVALAVPTREHGLGGTIGEFIDAAAQVAAEHGYHLVVWPFRTDQAEEIVNLAGQGMAIGVLVMEVSLDDARIDALDAAEIPYVMIGRTRELEGRRWVDVDFETTLEGAVRQLAELGHEHIAFLNHSEASADAGYAPVFRAEDAYAAAMSARGLTPVTLRCDDSPAAGRDAAGKLLEAAPLLTAVITMNEMATYGLLADFQARGLSIPADISVLSVVTSPGASQMANPPLTTMHSPGKDLGRAAVLRLLAAVGDHVPDPGDALITCTSEPGQSVAPPPARH